MVYLTGKNKTVVPSRELEEMICFPQQSIFSAGRKLKHFGFINTVSGPFGGYILAKQPGEITFYDILSAFKDDFSISKEININKASPSSLLNFASLFVEIESETNERMSGLTLSDLLNEANRSAKE